MFSDFTQYVRKPAGKMPPVSSQTVADADLSDIYAFLMTAAPAPGAFIATGPGDPQNGKRIFNTYGCSQCHGGLGQGSIQTGGPRVGPPVLSISAFAAYVHQPTGQMPPYTSKVVPDSEMADIYAFLQSIPAPASAKNIPLLNQ